LEIEKNLQSLAFTDPLTHLPNRRQLDMSLEKEFGRAARYQRPISIMMVDIDHFKAVNDTHGHPVGDEVLRQLGRLLTQGLRIHDTIGRYGGEEFLAILPETRGVGAI